jgi:uncharacterized membrane protein
MIVVTLFIEKENPACDQAIQDLESLQVEFPHRLAVVDISGSPELSTAYAGNTPVVQVGPYKLQKTISRQDLQIALGAARDRDAHLDKIGDKTYSRRIERGRSLTAADNISYWLSHHYMFVINVLLGLYVGLPFLAPILAHSGHLWAARAIQTIYSPLCHQLPYRSWFLFGEQPYYPRELAGIEQVGSYEDLIGGDPADLGAARKFLGSEEIGYGAGQAGYKIVLCQRDVAIYGMLFLFGIFFAVTGRKIKPVPWYLWIALGLAPIAVDGGSQLPGLIQALPDWLIMRESTPVLRTITGGLFGLMTAWYLFPMIEESMRETRALVARKMAVVPQIQKTE